MRSELKTVIVEEVSFNEESHTILTVHIETSPSKREKEILNTSNRQELVGWLVVLGLTAL